MNGKVYLVGAGPGDPGLITLRGKYLLERAEVVVYDYLASPKLLDHVPARAEMIYAGKKGGGLHAFTQERINQILVEQAKAGKMVVRLKGGDPFIFGRGAEEIEELVREGIPFEVVPGVTSATAAATYAGIPITHRGYTASVLFVTGHEDPNKKTSNIAWDKIATAAGTIVIYMGIKTLPMISQKLIEHGRSPETPVAVVRWASTPQQQSVVGTLATICERVQEADIKPPALIIVGEVVRLREIIDWYEKRPLFGKRIVVTRTREQASELVSRLEEHGADCLECATIHIEPMEDQGPLDQAIAQMSQYQWVLFTSTNAVRFFFNRLGELGQDSRLLGGARVAAVGRATAEALKNHGIRADLIPLESTGEGLAQALVALGVDKQKILLPRALKAGVELPKILTAGGATVDIVPIYRTIQPENPRENLYEQLTNKEIDLITFTSSSTVNNFMHILAAKDDEQNTTKDHQANIHSLLDGVMLAAIGPITATTLRKYGLHVDIQPERYTIDSLVEAIVRHAGNKDN